MLFEDDRVYTALDDKLQIARFDDELRLKTLGEIGKQVRDEFVVTHERVQALIDRVTARLEPARV